MEFACNWCSGLLQLPPHCRTKRLYSQKMQYSKTRDSAWRKPPEKLVGRQQYKDLKTFLTQVFSRGSRCFLVKARTLGMCSHASGYLITLAIATCFFAELLSCNQSIVSSINPFVYLFVTTGNDPTSSNLVETRRDVESQHFA